MNIQRRRAFTLIEVLIVIAIIVILMALLFPSFSAARENARQKTCASNLREIGLAVQMYRAEEKEYPMSLAVLLPPSAAPTPAATPATTAYAPKLDNTAATLFVGDPANANNSCAADNTCPNSGGTGYLKDTKVLLCPDDRSSSTQPRSSYGDLSTGVPDLAAGTLPANPDDLSRRAWNFWGYRNDNDGVAYNNQAVALAENSVAALAPSPAFPRLVDDSRQYVAPDTSYDPILAPNPEDYRTNVVKNSLSNRFAPPNTIVTYCPYHRVFTSNVSSPEKLYDPLEAANAAGARDLILRVDGSVKSVVVSTWGITDVNDPNYQAWQKQTFR